MRITASQSRINILDLYLGYLCNCVWNCLLACFHTGKAHNTHMNTCDVWSLRSKQMGGHRQTWVGLLPFRLKITACIFLVLRNHVSESQSQNKTVSTLLCIRCVIWPRVFANKLSTPIIRRKKHIQIQLTVLWKTITQTTQKRKKKNLILTKKA